MKQKLATVAEETMGTIKEPLTEAERRFAEENHDLLLRFSRRKKFEDYGDWYDVLALGYLRAVKRHSRDQHSCSFEEKCYRNMKDAAFDEFEFRFREKRYAKTFDLYAEVPGTDGAAFVDVVAAPAGPDAADLIDAADRCRALLRIAEHVERKVFCCLADGCTRQEIAVAMGVSLSTVDRIIRRFRRKAALIFPQCVPQKKQEEYAQRDRFSRRLRALLDETGMSARKLANKTGASHSMISDYLEGKYLPKSGHARKIADALETSVESLYPPPC
jgi:transcriptional regulator with XRE-family HTH domain